MMLVFAAKINAQSSFQRVVT
ncbi:MAG: hypothetical protein RL065_536, partial [Bacteroidota bacterium]